jgi:hypothetical protein
MGEATSIVYLDKRLSRAAEVGKGIRLEASDLDMLVSLGLIDMVHDAKVQFLKEQGRCRDARRRSISGENTGSIGTGGQTEASGPPSLRSIGTTPQPDAHAALRRAQRPRMTR